MSVTDYVALLYWTGMQGRVDKRGKIPDELTPILQRFGIAADMWSELVWNYKKYFGKSSSAGSQETCERQLHIPSDVLFADREPLRVVFSSVNTFRRCEDQVIELRRYR